MGGTTLRAAAVSMLLALPGINASSSLTACYLWGGSISSDHMRNSKGIHCLINISGTRGGANGNTYVFSRAQSLQNQRPLCGALNHPWMPNRLGCSDDLNLVLVAGPSAKAVS